MKSSPVITIEISKGPFGISWLRIDIGKGEGGYFISQKGSADFVKRTFTDSKGERRFQISKDESEQLFNGIKPIPNTAVTERELHVHSYDGTIYKVIFGNGLIQAKYEWSDFAPAGWQNLRTLIHRVTALIYKKIYE